jgi:hypothetical protein
MAHIEIIDGKEVMVASVVSKLKMAIEDPQETLKKFENIEKYSGDSAVGK